MTDSYQEIITKEIRDLLEHCDEKTRNLVSPALEVFASNEPYSELGGSYVVVRCCNDSGVDEWTNVGVMVYDCDGRQVWARMGPYHRAKMRGDFPDFLTEKMLDNYPSTKRHIGDVYLSQSSQGHAMGQVQMKKPLPLILDERACYSLYLKLVVGLRY